MKSTERFVIQNEWGKYLQMWTTGGNKVVKYVWLDGWHSCSVFKTTEHAKTELRRIKRPGRYQIIKIYILD